MKINLKLKKSLFFEMFLILPCFFYILARSNGNIELMFLSGLLLLIGSVCISVLDFEDNIAYLLFLCSCFLFMQGMYFINMLIYNEINTGFSHDISVHINDCIFLSILFLNIGYRFGYRIQFKNQKKSKHYLELDSVMLTKLRKITIVLFYISAVIFVIWQIEIILFVKGNSYLDYYLNYSTRLPRLLQVFGNMCIPFFWIYLATYPKKKDCIFPEIIYFISTILILFTGDRGGFIQNIAIWIVYAFWRQKRDNEIWIKKSYIFIGIISIPFLLAFLSYFVYLREGVDVGEVTILSQLQRFVSRTGTSANVIGYGKEFEDIFPKSYYLVGNLIDYIKYNPITNLMAGISRPPTQTVEYAFTMHSFESILSFFVYPQSYFNGHGVGSSYVAEAYHDFGYFGVILINILYGFILSRCKKINSSNPYKLAILFLMIRGLFYAPRGPALIFLTNIFNITTISAFIIVIVLVKTNIDFKFKLR